MLFAPSRADCLQQSDRKMHSCCRVIMQSSSLKHKAVTPSSAELPSLSPESSLLVMTEMSALCQGESHIAWPVHIVPHSQTPFFFSHHEYGCFPDFPQMGWICFLLSPPGRFSDDLSVHRPCSVFHKIVSFLLHFPLSLFLPSAIMTVTNHRVETFLFNFVLSPFLFVCCTPLVIYIIIYFLLNNLGNAKERGE